MSSAVRWVLFPFVVAGSAVAGGLAGILASFAAGIWELPVGGFLAALAALVSAAWIAPARRRLACAVVLAVGVAAAWELLEPSWFPEEYGQKAYQRTHQPFIATCLGGAVGSTVLAAHALAKKRA